jgi:hypothetical protein
MRTRASGLKTQLHFSLAIFLLATTISSAAVKKY